MSTEEYDKEKSEAPTRASDAESGKDSDYRGQVVGSYELVEILAKGGMGTVYLARHPKLPRKAVIKFLRNPDNNLHKELFEREAQVLASLGDHDNIVTIYEWGEQDNNGFFVMEFVDASLADLINRADKGLPAKNALAMIADAADALQYAHEKGILHRDVKPANLMYDTQRKRVKVTDFGVAKFMAPDGPKGGTIVGTPMYMAPEQLDASYIGPESDVYGLGITLAEALAGGVPPTETRGAIPETGEERPIIAFMRERRPDLDEAVLAIIDKATAMKRAKRYETMTAFSEDLRAVVNGLSSVAEKESKTSSKLAPTLLSEPPVEDDHRRSFLVAGSVVGLALVVSAVFAVPWLSGSGGTAQADALDRAKSRMDHGDLTGARGLYQAIIDSHGVSDVALYGLGYASIKDAEAAKAAFLDMEDEALRNEGLGAVAYAAGDYDNAATVLAQADTSYAGVLRAKMDEAVSADDLAEFTRDPALYFNWQRHEALRLLGQAYYRLGRLDEAERAFEEIRGTVGGEGFAALYAERIAERRAYTERFENIAAVREAIASRELPEAEGSDDEWTSEPLRYLVVPVTDGIGPVGRELGIADWLATLLMRSLESETALRPVNRDEIDRVLQEYMLMGALGDPAEQRNLGKLRGARLLFQFGNLSLGTEQEWTIDVVDTRTTEQFQAGGVPYTQEFSRDSFVEEITNRIADAVAKRYPLRGRVYREGDKAILNIGEAVGVVAGMRFDLRESDQKRDRVENAWVEVGDTEAIDEEATVVSLSGIDVSKLPKSKEDALYAEIMAQ